LTPCVSLADVVPAALFTDHMVIQRETQAPVWGSADAGEKVSVTGSWGESAATTADASGKWMVKLKTPEAGGPHTLILKGNNMVTIKDVLSATAKDILRVDVTDFQIPNIDYTPGFRRAVEQAAIAKTLVEKAEQEKREKTVQAETAKIEALGKANALREDAKGKADAIRFNAEATASQIRLEGVAKAEAIEKQAKALGNNPLLVEYRKAEQWKGDVPQWTGGGGLPVINLSPPAKR